MAHQGFEPADFETRCLPRAFIESRHIAWVLLLASLLWGVFGYLRMARRKDPEIPVGVAVAVCAWPGASAERVERLLTKRIEARIAENLRVERIESISRTNVSIVYVHLDPKVEDNGREFDDIRLKLDALRGLPDGAGPVEFIKDFGDTATLMLTVASPKASSLEVELRARALSAAIVRAREGVPAGAARAALALVFPRPPDKGLLERPIERFSAFLQARGLAHDIRPLAGAGIGGVDVATTASDADLLSAASEFLRDRVAGAEIEFYAWSPILVRDPSECAARLAAVAGSKYTLRELADFADRIDKAIRIVPQVAKVTPSGVLDEEIHLYFTQERLAAGGLKPADLPRLLGARNIAIPGGVMNVGGRDVAIDPSGDFKSEREIGDVAVGASPSGAAVYLRDLVDILRGYSNPPRYLNFLTCRDLAGAFQRMPAVTLAVQMRAGERVGEFGEAVDRELAAVTALLPPDLVVARTSDQPLQVSENIGLFMRSLLEAVILVVLVSYVGFRDVRSALLMAAAIPITLALTFGAMHTLGLDLQQVSIASLILALGLLVDVPVVAGDAIKRHLAIPGLPPGVAAWLGPHKLMTAIFFATLTNIVAYLPLLGLEGNVGRFLRSLPLVITISLLAAWLVSITFVPLLGSLLLQRGREAGLDELKTRPYARLYGRAVRLCVARRRIVLALLALLLLPGVACLADLRQQFFPKDLSYLSYVDIWMPEDSPLASTDAVARRAETVIRETAERFGRDSGSARPAGVLKSLATFVGGGGPRFWFSVEPVIRQLNYAQVIVETNDKRDTAPLVAKLQSALSGTIAGARIDVRQLETSEPVGVPVSLRLSGDDPAVLRAAADRLKADMIAEPLATRVRDDWGTDNLAVALRVEPDRANLVGATNYDVAVALAVALSGYTVTRLREGDKQIPVVARLVAEERTRLEDIGNLSVCPSIGSHRVPMRQVTTRSLESRPETIRRRNQFRTVTVSCFPVEGALPSDVMKRLRGPIARAQAALPPGFRLEIGGEEEKQVKGFRDLLVVLAVSLAMIYLALVFQFRDAVKPLIVFGAIPFGLEGAVLTLWYMDTPFGFMAFLGVASLVGVIVSHIIVLFDFIEEAIERGEPLVDALADAGIVRLRPVLITVAATMIALVPLAKNGGPLWEPMCYAQIGGLAVATAVTLLVVPVLYAFLALDLHLIASREAGTAPPAPASR